MIIWGLSNQEPTSSLLSSFYTLMASDCFHFVMKILLVHHNRKVAIVIEIKTYVFKTKRSFMRKFTTNKKKNRLAFIHFTCLDLCLRSLTLLYTLNNQETQETLMPKKEQSVRMKTLRSESGVTWRKRY